MVFDFSCFAIGCEEEIMYPRTFEISRNLFYRMPTTPAATTGMPRFESQLFIDVFFLQQNE